MANRCDCSVIIPTHNRPRILSETLNRLAELPDRRFEVVVIDNGSSDSLAAIREQHPEVRWIYLPQNIGAAARNLGAAAANGRVLLMLDDDSWPEDGTIESGVRLFDSRFDLGAAACRVRLADKPDKHDAGGVPGIFFNCGGFVRKTAFLEAGGFSFHFDYYVEEYDLSCRLLQRGWSIEPRSDLHIWHRRVRTGRDNNRMLRLLTRNNLRLWRRYAPEARLQEMLNATLDRYERVALKEDAREGYEAGVLEAEADEGPLRARRTPLSTEQFNDLFGLRTAESALRSWADKGRIRRVAIWSRGKGAELIVKLAEEACLSIAAVYDDFAESEQWLGHRLNSFEHFDPHGVDGIIVGSLSPGVAEDVHRELSRRFPFRPVVSLATWAGIAAGAEMAVESC